MKAYLLSVVCVAMAANGALCRADIVVVGTTFGLPPNFKPITDVPVEVRAFPPRSDPNRPGELLRVGGNLVPQAQAVASTTTNRQGEYRLNIPFLPNKRGIFILRFNRKAQAITQTISGTVLTDGVEQRLDTVVPIPEKPCCGQYQTYRRHR